MPDSTESKRVVVVGSSFAGMTAALELRKITATATTAGTTPQPLCGPSTPATYVAFAYDQPTTATTMLVFSGEEAPGDTATKSQLCGTFAFGG